MEQNKKDRARKGTLVDVREQWEKDMLTHLMTYGFRKEQMSFKFISADHGDRTEVHFSDTLYELLDRSNALRKLKFRNCELELRFKGDGVVSVDIPIEAGLAFFQFLFSKTMKRIRMFREKVVKCDRPHAVKRLVSILK